MAEFVTGTGCTVSVWYVSMMSMWDTPGIWLILRMIPPDPHRRDGRAASIVFAPFEAEVLIAALEQKPPDPSWFTLGVGGSFRVVEVQLDDKYRVPGIYLLLRKDDESVSIELRLTPDEAATLVVALRYALEEAGQDV